MLDQPSFAQGQAADAPGYLPLAALLVGFAAYWFPFFPVIGACSVGSYANMARCVIVFLLAMAGGFLPWQKVSRYGLMGVMGAWLLDVVLSLQLPAVFHCSHQLLPFEGAMLYGVAALCSWVGYSGARLFSRVLAPDFVARERPRLAYATLALGALIAPLTTVLLPFELRAHAQGALATLQMLSRQQAVFHSSNTQAGYACQFADLAPELSNTGHFSEKGKNYEYAIKGGYTFRLWCGSATPRDQYLLEAFPTCVPSCGNVAFCTSHTGRIKSVTRSANPNWDTACWTEGVELALP